MLFLAVLAIDPNVRNWPFSVPPSFAAIGCVRCQLDLVSAWFCAHRHYFPRYTFLIALYRPAITELPLCPIVPHDTCSCPGSHATLLHQHFNSAAHSSTRIRAGRLRFIVTATHSRTGVRARRLHAIATTARSRTRVRARALRVIRIISPVAVNASRPAVAEVERFSTSAGSNSAHSPFRPGSRP